MNQGTVCYDWGPAAKGDSNVVSPYVIDGTADNMDDRYMNNTIDQLNAV